MLRQIDVHKTEWNHHRNQSLQNVHLDKSEMDWISVIKQQQSSLNLYLKQMKRIDFHHFCMELNDFH